MAQDWEAKRNANTVITAMSRRRWGDDFTELLEEILEGNGINALFSATWWVNLLRQKRKKAQHASLANGLCLRC
jgi:hypothetical protein